VGEVGGMDGVWQQTITRSQRGKEGIKRIR
jgi:hypothetical protein